MLCLIDQPRNNRRHLQKEENIHSHISFPLSPVLYHLALLPRFCRLPLVLTQMGYIAVPLFYNSDKPNSTDPPGFALRVHEHFHLRGIHKIQKPRLRRLVISDGMSPRRLQPKGVPPTMASSSQSSPTPPAHICLCQPTPKIPRPRNGTSELLAAHISR